MKVSKVLASLAAVSLLSAPIVAQAAPAQLRTSSEVEGENLRGGFLIPLVALIAIILGIVVVVGDEDDAPHSP